MSNAMTEADGNAGSEDLRCGVIAVVGRTNVGKSTLVNQLVGEKVSIVSDMVQTTRNRVRAVLTEPRGQLVLIDTPGVHKARSQLGTLMNRMARGSTAGADGVVLVCDVSEKPRDEDVGWVAAVSRRGVPWVGVLNKCDRATTHADTYRALIASGEGDAPVSPPVGWFELSAATGEGSAALLAALFEMVPQGPLLFPEHVISDFPEKLAVADVIREKLVARLRDEIPHAVAVKVDSLDKQPDRMAIEATVYVDRSSQKGIVIGHKGRVLRAVRRQAEAELGALYETTVSINLWVKVEPGWQENFWMLQQLGYTE